MHPLPLESLSQESGGQLTAEEAYSDGVGVILTEKPNSSEIDYSILNSLVKKYGKAAKKSGLSLKEYIETTITDNNDLEKAAMLVSAYKNGDSCDDGNEKTINDTWTDGVCSGIVSGPIVFSTGNPFLTLLSEEKQYLLLQYLNLTGNNVEANYIGEFNDDDIASIGSELSKHNHLLYLIKLRNQELIGGYTSNLYYSAGFKRAGTPNPVIFNLDKKIYSTSISSLQYGIYMSGSSKFGFGQLDLYISTDESVVKNRYYKTNTGKNLIGLTG